MRFCAYRLRLTVDKTRLGVYQKLKHQLDTGKLPEREYLSIYSSDAKSQENKLPLKFKNNLGLYSETSGSEHWLLRYRRSRRFSSVPQVGNSATQVGNGVLSTWTKCPNWKPQLLRFLNKNKKQKKKTGAMYHYIVLSSDAVLFSSTPSLQKNLIGDQSPVLVFIM